MATFLVFRFDMLLLGVAFLVTNSFDLLVGAKSLCKPDDDSAHLPIDNNHGNPVWWQFSDWIQLYAYDLSDHAFACQPTKCRGQFFVYLSSRSNAINTSTPLLEFGSIVGSSIFAASIVYDLWVLKLTSLRIEDTPWIIAVFLVFGGLGAIGQVLVMRLLRRIRRFKAIA